MRGNSYFEKGIGGKGDRDRIRVIAIVGSNIDRSRFDLFCSLFFLSLFLFFFFLSRARFQTRRQHIRNVLNIVVIRQKCMVILVRFLLIVLNKNNLLLVNSFFEISMR